MSDDRKQYAHLYGRLWKRLSKAFLRRNPLCSYCAELGIRRAARVVDHRIPHRGDRGLFFDQANWQPLCLTCHDGVKQREERTGRREGCDVNGMPRDSQHEWNEE
jgi:5-methylcytosine-specific restriction protein A